MRNIIVFSVFFLLLFTGQAMAQEAPINKLKKVEDIQKTYSFKTEAVLNLNWNTDVARLYKNRNTRIIKALNFHTKANKPKIA
jgi:hypothetical protein